MSGKEIQEWFDRRDVGANPHFLCRVKFPNFALALVFDYVNGMSSTLQSTLQFRQLVELNLCINRRRVPCKGYHYFRVAGGHVLICDMRLVFSDKEQLDALCVEQQWNLVQVSCEDLSSLKLSCWGVYVYRDGTNYNLYDVQFTCPHPMYSDMSPSTLDPTEDPWTKPKKKIAKLHLDDVFDTMMMAVEFYKYFPVKVKEELYPGVAVLKQLCMQAKDELESEDSVLQNSDPILTSILGAFSSDLPLPERGQMYSLNQRLLENTSGKDFEKLINQVWNTIQGLSCQEKMNGVVATEKHRYPNSTDTDEATLKWFADSIDNEQEAELENLYHKDVREASCSKAQDYDPQQHKLMMRKMLYDGVTNGNCLLLFPSDNKHPFLAVSMNYTMGVTAGILAAKSSCPSLDFQGIWMVCVERMCKNIFGDELFQSMRNVLEEYSNSK